ncbi:MAG: hypothetical protein HY288_10595 [Planctomycetia bacterium]|nr:hypothetical protein [Planctomycetia bacterium]
MTAASVSAILVPAFAGKSVADGAQLRARFESEAPKSWSRFVATAEQMDFEFTQQVIRASGEQQLKMSAKVSEEHVLQATTLLNLRTKSDARPDGKQTVATLDRFHTRSRSPPTHRTRV